MNNITNDVYKHLFSSIVHST